MKATLLCILAALLTIAAPATAEPPQAAFSGTTSVLEIEVPVRVLSDGHPVRGLRFPAARDFTTSLVLPPVPVQLRTLVRERRTGKVTLSSVPVGVAAAEPIR